MESSTCVSKESEGATCSWTTLSLNWWQGHSPHVVQHPELVAHIQTVLGLANALAALSDAFQTDCDLCRLLFQVRVYMWSTDIESQTSKLCPNLMAAQPTLQQTELNAKTVLLDVGQLRQGDP